MALFRNLPPASPERERWRAGGVNLRAEIREIVGEIFMEHHHNHNHGHLRETGTRRLRVILVLTSLFFVVEVLGGLWTNSLALLSDAGHMLSDIFALGLSLFAFWLSSKRPSRTKTYGYYRFEVVCW
jgi:Co/Zn/Cd efflux system component